MLEVFQIFAKNRGSGFWSYDVILMEKSFFALIWEKKAHPVNCLWFLWNLFSWIFDVVLGFLNFLHLWLTPITISSWVELRLVRVAVKYLSLKDPSENQANFRDCEWIFALVRRNVGLRLHCFPVAPATLHLTGWLFFWWIDAEFEENVLLEQTVKFLCGALSLDQL